MGDKRALVNIIDEAQFYRVTVDDGTGNRTCFIIGVADPLAHDINSVLRLAQQMVYANKPVGFDIESYVVGIEEMSETGYCTKAKG